MHDDTTSDRVQPQQLTKSDFDDCYERFAAGVKAFLKAKLSSEPDVDDCLNRVFQKLWTHGNQVQPAARGAWLFAVARQESALHWRQRQRQETVYQQLAEDRSHYQSSAHNTAEPVLSQLETAELRQQLQAAIAHLPDEQQQVLARRIHQQQTFRQIAEQLQIPLGTAISRFHQAIAKLKSLMDQ